MKIKLLSKGLEKPYIKSLLRARGIEDVETFLEPTHESLQSWKDLKDIEKGVRLIQDLREGARIMLVVDSDVDGYTSSAIIYQYLRRIKPDLTIETFLHEGKEHGLEDCWETIRDGSFDLVIVPDAGSDDKKYAIEISAPILVIDHHPTANDFAPNMVVINNQISPLYRNKSLSGAGMAFQFCLALDVFFQVEYAWNYVDLAALGVCADMMSGLMEENQFLWRVGFSEIKNPLFLAIARKQAFSILGSGYTSDKELFGAITPMSVAYYVVPLINALIRVGSYEEKKRMWLSFIDGNSLVPSQKRGAKGILDQVVNETTREAINARSRQNKIKESVVEKLEIKIAKYDLLENQVLFIRLDDEDVFPKELNGLVAMQLSRQYKKPTLIGRVDEDGMVKGSVRGLSNSELRSMKQYLLSTGLFIYVQGHDNACGFCIPDKNLAAFHKKANKELAVYNFGNFYYEVEFVAEVQDLNLREFVENISRYKYVWSQNCSEPLVYVQPLVLEKKEIRIMGRNKDTVKFVKNEVAFMKFFAKEFIQEIDNLEGEYFYIELVGRANLNYWNGTETPQIFIDNYEIKPFNVLGF